MGRVLAIINPAAGSARRAFAASDDGDLLTKLTAALRVAFPHADVRVRPTSAFRDAAAVARDELPALRPHDLLIAAGGDGTANAVANAILAAPLERRPALGILPLGTGNDLARSLGIPLEAVPALTALASAAPRAIDAVRLHCAPLAPQPAPDGTCLQAAGGQRWFLNSSALGLLGEVGERTAQSAKGWWGNLAYFATAAADVLAGPTPYRVRISFESATPAMPILELQTPTLVVCNGRSMGGGTAVAPDADLADGLLDLVAARVDTGAALTLLAAKVLAGAHAQDPAVVLRRAGAIRIESDRPMPVNADGDLAGATPARYHVEPGALQVLAACADP